MVSSHSFPRAVSLSCLCVCACLHVYVRTHVRICFSSSARASPRARACVRAYACAHVRARLRVSARVCVRESVRVRTGARGCAHGYPRTRQDLRNSKLRGYIWGRFPASHGLGIKENAPLVQRFFSSALQACSGSELWILLGMQSSGTMRNFTNSRLEISTAKTI